MDYARKATVMKVLKIGTHLSIVLLLSVGISSAQSPAADTPPSQTVSEINTSGLEDVPYISKDGTKLYFHYSPFKFSDFKRNKLTVIGPLRRPSILRDYRRQYFIGYVSKKKDGKWQEPVLIDFENEAYAWGSVDISSDEKYMYTIGPGNPMKQGDMDIYVHRLKDASWVDAKRVKGINTEYTEDDPDIAKDNTFLAWDSNRPEGYGMRDLWFSEIDHNGEWAKPENFGTLINSEFNEQYPYLNDEGNRLYFNRAIPAELMQGKIGIYMSENVNGQWSVPIRLDVGIDIALSPSLTLDEKTMYFEVGQITNNNPATLFDNNLDIYYSTKRSDDSWTKAIPVDGKPFTEKIPAAVPDTVNYEKIDIVDETSRNGAFDLSLEYDRKTKIGWMAYSALSLPYIHTHLARSTDHGKTWKYIQEVNNSYDGQVKLKGKVIKGSWWNEVPTLVHDPLDTGKEWKLYWHKYFSKRKPGGGPSNRVLQFSWIAYKYASSPDGKWSKEIHLFGAGKFPLDPYQAKINLNDLHPDLRDNKTYTEPGSLYKDGVIYLSLQGFKSKFNNENSRLFLLASYDHGITWKYLGTLLDNKDALRLGYTRLSASSLAQEGSRMFLLVAPIKKEGNDGKHVGTYVFEFEDIGQAKLKRAATNKLIVHKYLPPSIITKNAGESDYDQFNTYGGIVMPQQDKSELRNSKNPRKAEVFKIFNTKEILVDKE